MKKYSEGNFREIADMISDDSGEYYFNNVKVDKEGWLSAAEGHHDLFENIQNDTEGINLTSAKYNNGTTWSMAWFQWTSKVDSFLGRLHCVFVVLRGFERIGMKQNS